MKKKIKNKPIAKRSLKNFMKDESGSMTKENILKIGIGTIAALSAFSGLAKGQVGPAPPCDGEYTHVSDNTLQGTGSDIGTKTIVPSHTHHAAHCSY